MIYAFKADPKYADLLSRSLHEGVGRFGWSYVPTADLRALQDRIERERRHGLSEDERNCYQRFLLDLRPDDYVVYINLPLRGKCTLARVTGEYYWEWGGEGSDFNHRFSVDPNSIREFDRNDSVVHPALSAKLKLRGRWYRIFLQDEFRQLLDGIEQGKTGLPSTVETRSRWLREKVYTKLREITTEVQHANPNFDLEKLMEAVLSKVPGVKDVQRKHGRGDKGADLLVTIEERNVITDRVEQRTGVVQVKSFTGRHEVAGAVNDIERAFVYYDADFGLIVSTATERGDDLEGEAEELAKRTGKRVDFLTGNELALFLLRHGEGLITD